MTVFTVIGIIVVACLLISFFNSKTLSYQQKTTIIGLVLLAFENSNNGEYQKATDSIDRALNIDPYNQKLRAIKKAIIASSTINKQIPDTYMSSTINDIANHYKI